MLFGHAHNQHSAFGLPFRHLPKSTGGGLMNFDVHHVTMQSAGMDTWLVLVAIVRVLKYIVGIAKFGF